MIPEQVPFPLQLLTALHEKFSHWEPTNPELQVQVFGAEIKIMSCVNGKKIWKFYLFLTWTVSSIVTITHKRTVKIFTSSSRVSCITTTSVWTFSKKLLNELKQKGKKIIYFSPEQFPLLLQLLKREQSKFWQLVPE